jgi:hypothetical protein
MNGCYFSRPYTYLVGLWNVFLERQELNVETLFRENSFFKALDVYARSGHLYICVSPEFVLISITLILLLASCWIGHQPKSRNSNMPCYCI